MKHGWQSLVIKTRTLFELMNYFGDQNKGLYGCRRVKCFHGESPRVPMSMFPPSQEIFGARLDGELECLLCVGLGLLYPDEHILWYILKLATIVQLFSWLKFGVVEQLLMDKLFEFELDCFCRCHDLASMQAANLGSSHAGGQFIVLSRG